MKNYSFIIFTNQKYFLKMKLCNFKSLLLNINMKVQIIGHVHTYSPTVCATPILAMGYVMGQFPLCNGVLLMITIR